jgi:hypothetical protein
VVVLAEAGHYLHTAPDSSSMVIGILPYNELANVTGQSPDGRLLAFTNLIDNSVMVMEEGQ